MKKCRNSLSSLRQSSGLTLQELSTRTGVPLSTIGNFERGIRGISDEALRRIVEVLGASVTEIASSHDLQKDQIAESAPDGRLRSKEGTDKALVYLYERAATDTLVGLLGICQEVGDIDLMAKIAKELANRASAKADRKDAQPGAKAG